MTCNTLRGSSSKYAVFVTARAVDILMLAYQWEGCVVVIEGYILPAAWVMTGLACRAKLSVVCIPGSMAGVTICWCAFIHTVSMAGLALNADVIAS